MNRLSYWMLTVNDMELLGDPLAPVPVSVAVVLPVGPAVVLLFDVLVPPEPPLLPHAAIVRRTVIARIASAALHLRSLSRPATRSANRKARDASSMPANIQGRGKVR